jgi:biopolymer transport protein ExbD
MPLKRPPKATSMTLNLAPMVDVMMCLIIFFLLASKLADEMDVQLPWAVAAETPEEVALGNRITLSVRRAGAALDEVEYSVRDWDGEKITNRFLTPNDVMVLLRARALRAEQAGQTLRCVINADREVPYAAVEVLLRACGLAKISNVVFATQKGAPPE